MLLLLATSALAQQPARSVEVASTGSTPVRVWVDFNGVVKANEHLVTLAAVEAAVAATGDSALVVWTEADGTVRAMPRNVDGTAAGAASAIGSNATGAVAVAAASDRYFIAWAGSLGEVYGALVSTAGVVLVPAMPVTAQSGVTISRIAAAANANGFAVVWDVRPVAGVFATTLDPNGVPVSMTPLVLSEYGWSPDVTTDGNTFFAVWAPNFARTFTIDRSLGRVRTVAKGGGSMRVAWDGFAYSVAFTRLVPARGGFMVPEIAAIRINAYGAYVGQLMTVDPFVSMASTWDIDASDGRIDLLFSSAGVHLESRMAEALPKRARSARH